MAHRDLRDVVCDEGDDLCHGGDFGFLRGRTLTERRASIYEGSMHDMYPLKGRRVLKYQSFSSELKPEGNSPNGQILYLRWMWEWVVNGYGSSFVLIKPSERVIGNGRIDYSVIFFLSRTML